MIDINLILEKYKNLISNILQSSPDFITVQVKGNHNDWLPICIDYYNKERTEITWELGEYRVLFGETTIATWRLYQLQHCCAFAVSCQAFVHTDFRSKGLGTIMNNFRQDICRYLGYSALLCTDVDKNENQRKILKTNGWRDIFNLINKRTNNRVYLSVINL